MPANPLTNGVRINAFRSEQAHPLYQSQLIKLDGIVAVVVHGGGEWAKLERDFGMNKGMVQSLVT